MIYKSTRGGDTNKSFIDVLLNGLASDGGLYVPKKIPSFSTKKIKSFKNLKYHELVFHVTKEFIKSDEISESEYKKICNKTYLNFSKHETLSLTKLNSHEAILNLFNGPTFAFKDFALQLLGNIYMHVLKKNSKQLIILGATSGDTGSAAIYGCSGSSQVKLFILFPKGKVSEIQRKQMTTYEKENVFNIEVDGNFDDCQKLVKKFFLINRKYNLAAINSINWVRIMGQIVYYFWSYLRMQTNMDIIDFVVPTGNFGNVYAGFYAKKMGLPIGKLVVASNKNDILTRFFESGKMKVLKSKKSLSPSMDIQVSSNFERLLYYYTKDSNKVKNFYLELDKRGFFAVQPKVLREMLEVFSSGKLSDINTMKTIEKIYKKFKIIIDPHTAVGYSVGKKLLKEDNKTIYLATAHYSKFLDTVEKSVKKKLEYPQKLKKILNKKENFIKMKNDLRELGKLIDKFSSLSIAR